MMFNVGEKIVSKSGKVCEIIAIENIKVGEVPTEYYVLSPCFSSNDSLKIYVPVSKGDTLRKVLSRDEVLKLVTEIPNIEPIWIANPKIRKAKFKELSVSGNPLDIFLLIKSYNKKKEEFKELKKSLSFTDENFLKELKSNIYYEMAVALDTDVNGVEEFLKAKAQI